MAVHPLPLRCSIGRPRAASLGEEGRPASVIDISLLLSILNPTVTADEEVFLRRLIFRRAERRLEGEPVRAR